MYIVAAQLVVEPDQHDRFEEHVPGKRAGLPKTREVRFSGRIAP